MAVLGLVVAIVLVAILLLGRRAPVQDERPAEAGPLSTAEQLMALHMQQRAAAAELGRSALVGGGDAEILRRAREAAAVSARPLVTRTLLLTLRSLGPPAKWEAIQDARGLATAEVLAWALSQDGGEAIADRIARRIADGEDPREIWREVQGKPGR